jgi:aryl-alcohol dehydrogenase-like predicted oxidoreductase
VGSACWELFCFEYGIQYDSNGMLSRKHIIEGTRLQLDYVDILFAHRPDPYTPMEETCRAFYWGTSHWTAEQAMDTFECCDRLGLAKPVADQEVYNMLVRYHLEDDYVPLFEKHGYGITIYSPLAGGYLTGSIMMLQCLKVLDTLEDNLILL